MISGRGGTFRHEMTGFLIPGGFGKARLGHCRPDAGRG
jgi:hypothetical protein